MNIIGIRRGFGLITFLWPLWTANAQVKAVQVDAGQTFSCALRDDGKVKCWGNADLGQLGLGDVLTRGDTASTMGANLPAVDLGSGRTATRIAAGRYFACALLDDATVKCWGNNDWGQLGQGDVLTRGDAANQMGAFLPAVDLGPGRTAVDIAAGAYHACALLDNDRVKCWGHNGDGQLGQGDTSYRGDGPGEMGANLATVPLGLSRTAVQLAGGEYHTCALLDNGSVKCWGSNFRGQLGQGDTNDRGDGPGEMAASLATINLGTGRTAVQIAAGAYHSCALLDNGRIRCWGRNSQGELGLGDNLDRGDGPGEMGNSLGTVSLGAGRTAVKIAAGGEDTCALLDTNEIKCWGDNFEGQLGQGDTASRGDGPGEMAGNLATIDLGTGSTATDLTVSDEHVCAVLNDGAVKCWGYNYYAALGLGDTSDRGDGAGEMGDLLPVVDLGP